MGLLPARAALRGARRGPQLSRSLRRAHRQSDAPSTARLRPLPQRARVLRRLGHQLQPGRVLRQAHWRAAAGGHRHHRIHGRPRRDRRGALGTRATPARSDRPLGRRCPQHPAGGPQIRSRTECPAPSLPHRAGCADAHRPGAIAHPLARLCGLAPQRGGPLAEDPTLPRRG